MTKKEKLTERDINLKEMFENHGVIASFHDLAIKGDINNSYHDFIGKFKESLLKRYKNQWIKWSVEDKIASIKELSVDNNGITVELIDIENSRFEAYIVKLLFLCSKDRKRDPYSSLQYRLSYDESLKVIQDSFIPAKITRMKEGKEIVGYTFLNGVIDAKKHASSRKLTNSYEDYQLIYDISRLMATLTYEKSIYSFAVNNPDLMQYRVAQSYLKAYYKPGTPLRLPANREFAFELMDYIRVQNMLEMEPEISEKGISCDIDEVLFHVKEKPEAIFSYINYWKLPELVLPEMLETMEYLRDKNERQFEQRKTYATAYMDKKHIKKSVKEKMDDNLFLQRYGKVELDSDVDLEEFNLFQQDFVELSKFIPIPTCPDHAFRIRKLGKHRAAGIYFSFYKTTVFDIGYPSAFCHELGHQIDYVWGDQLYARRSLLSEQFNFKPIIELYRSSVESTIHALDKDHPTRIQWEGKTKYNRNYFLQYTEIFARSFELYLYHCKGLRLSLLKKDYTAFQYPSDETYMKRVKSYFDKLLSDFHVEPICMAAINRPEQDKKIELFDLEPIVIEQKENELIPPFIQQDWDQTNEQHFSEEDGQLCLLFG